MLKLADRVKESSLTEGDVSYIVLNDTYGSFQSFKDAIGDGNTTYYTIENNDQFEVGIGKYNEDENKIERSFVLDSSNNGNRIILLGVSVVFCTYPADRSFFLNESGFATAPSTYYSGIQFPHSGVQYYEINGSGNSDYVTFWKEPRLLTGDHNLQYSVENNTLTVGGIANFLSDVFVSGNITVQGTQYVTETQIINSQITDTTFSNTTFYRDDAGCFFHAYVDNDFDNTIALYSTNEFCTEWRLGVKDYSPAFESPPTRGYVFGDCERVGGVVYPNTLYTLSFSNGFLIKHHGYNIMQVNETQGMTLDNFVNTVQLNVVSSVGQTHNLQEWQDFNHQPLSFIDRFGKFVGPGIRFVDPDTPEFNLPATQTVAYTQEYRTVNSQTFLNFTDDIIFAEVNSTYNIYLPDSVGLGGKKIVIKRTKTPDTDPDNSYKLNILPAIGRNQTIDGEDKLVLNYSNESITLISDNSNWHII